MATDPQALLRLLQLASPALPVGAFSYSEGLETLIQRQVLQTPDQIYHWLEQELCYGAVRLEAAVMLRGYQALQVHQLERLDYWNAWLSALRETAELRQQSWQMGRALVRTLEALHPDIAPWVTAVAGPCHFAIAFAMAAVRWQIDAEDAMLGYLQSWASNLVNAAIRLVPLGQTVGQRLLLDLSPTLAQVAAAIPTLADDQLVVSGWGPSLASMTHETLYSRLFRS
ncbi:Urease accessory protein UreF [Halomicronema hongdechloris C2206]|uniref:Urease accessory protein UreF n=2 Tax=Halomicronema hongdechloris TaxID=1209493 RepID=A0A1Z3HVE7_9CYAN|nr:urease accessory protein UreF [Halomicronema hongdechloris]ASC74288.1 Urease accessory protein UreF [Halomicronema hongdechloris C2206]